MPMMSTMPKVPMHQPGASRQPIRAIITGATGMVGEGVLHECLQHPDVEHVLVLTRKPCGYSHPKLTELLHDNFYDLSAIQDKLQGYNACYFCLGVSSVGMSEADYERVTYTLTLHLANTLTRLNEDMVFCYVTGTGTDSTEKGSRMWARVKGRTENALLRLPFRRAYMYRPGYIHPTPGLRNTHKYYKYMSWLYPIVNRLFPNAFITLREVGLSMIHAFYTDYERTVLNPADIRKLAAHDRHPQH
ncbi:NAD-dependent epimerase/dehydratase family protein [Paenibacillus koleovorans]|uniref:NAD-dependent epimerase/dehydratase family protein n=1 Tax=Paenibacillus koleovorans TaxID=121608 RepID=UPI001FE573A8|nr:NAD-dependent epimerase/dehydratase family protein [Paenibacillus koleovorans]